MTKRKNGRSSSECAMKLVPELIVLANLGNNESYVLEVSPCVSQICVLLRHKAFHLKGHPVGVALKNGQGVSGILCRAIHRFPKCR